MNLCQQEYPVQDATNFQASGAERLNNQEEHGNTIWNVQPFRPLNEGVSESSTAVITSQVFSTKVTQVQLESGVPKMNSTVAGLANGIIGGKHGDERPINVHREEDRMHVKTEESEAQDEVGSRQPPSPLIPKVSTWSSLSLDKSPNAEQFLKFELEGDKKVISPVKVENGTGSRSRSNSPITKSEAKDEEEEDVKPKAKPGIPRSISHLPSAEKEVCILLYSLLPIYGY